MRWALLFLCFWLPLANAGKVYVCKTESGQTLFSQVPCPAGYSDQAERNIEVDKPSTPPSAVSSQRQKMAQDLSNSNARIRAERDLKNAEKNLKELEAQREKMIREKTEQARSLGGQNARNRSQAIMDEMKREAEGYSQKIRNQRESMANARKQLDELNKQPEPPAENPANAL